MIRIFSRRSIVASAAMSVAALAFSGRAAGAAVDRRMQVRRNPGCGCCESWMALMEEAGFAVDMRDDENLDAYRTGLGVPPALAGCHTGIADGYVIEGHVPAQDIVRLLTERPDALGIAVPGMPMGSPGMEAGGQKDPFDVVLFRKDGTSAVFNTYT